MVIRGTVPRPPHKALKTLSPGRATSNTIDLMCLRVVTGWLSTLTDKLLAPAMKLADNARRSFTEIEAGLCPHTLGVLKLIALMTGKKSAAPSGTEQVRVAALPLKNPARNQTGSLCPTMQFTPVVSSRGLTTVGMESAHCHHCAVSSSRSVSEVAVDVGFACDQQCCPNPNRIRKTVVTRSMIGLLRFLSSSFNGPAASPCQN